MGSPPTLDLVFAAGHGVGRERISVDTIAEIVVPSGYIVACDPLVGGLRPPFSSPFPRGRFPCVITTTTNYRSPLALAIRFSLCPITSFTLARTQLREAETGEGYGVDAGMGCFVDASAVARLRDPDVSKLLLEARPASLTLDEGTGANVVSCTSGAGDGVYSTWVGQASDGSVAALVTDFQLEALERILWGGPWVDERHACLSLLLDFLGSYGRPSEAWLTRHLPGHEALSALFRAERHGSTLQRALRGTAHPARRAGIIAHHASALMLIERYGLESERARCEALSSRLRELPLEVAALDESHSAVSKLFLELMREVNAQHPIDPEARFAAAIHGRSFVDPRAQLRAYLDELALREAELMLAALPVVPSLDDLSASATSAR